MSHDAICRHCGHTGAEHADGPCLGHIPVQVDETELGGAIWDSYQCGCDTFEMHTRKHRTPEELAALAELVRNA